jgi:acylphosphatase
MKNIRCHVRIDGRVQGVCFRMDTRRAALGRNLTGWVRNLPNGSVDAVFEGAEADVKSMLKWCEFDTFEITFA